jgi:mannose/fructose/N-acetylgalactosamine-specific phosphotransferase system component IID
MRLYGWPAIIIVSSIGVALAMVGDIEAPVRPLIAFWFLLICPGMAFIRLLHLQEWLTELTLAIALSLTMDTLVAEAMVLNHHWSPQWALFGLICLSLVGAALQVIKALGHFLHTDRQNLW